MFVEGNKEGPVLMGLYMVLEVPQVWCDLIALLRTMCNLKCTDCLFVELFI